MECKSWTYWEQSYSTSISIKRTCIVNQKGVCFAENENVRSQNINSFYNWANQIWSWLLLEWGSPENTQWCLSFYFLAGNNQSSLLISYIWCLSLNFFLTLKYKFSGIMLTEKISLFFSPSAQLPPPSEWERPRLGPYWKGNLDAFVHCFPTWLSLCIFHSRHQVWVFKLSYILFLN